MADKKSKSYKFDLGSKGLFQKMVNKEKLDDVVQDDEQTSDHFKRQKTVYKKQASMIEKMRERLNIPSVNDEESINPKEFYPSSASPNRERRNRY